jgi:putative tryptophan/tyrosine transport system substrate-binding protein
MLEVPSVTVRVSGAQRMANYVKKIVDGPRLREMPIRTLSQHELVVNLQTAHNLAYRCRPDLRSKAVQVIPVIARTMD